MPPKRKWRESGNEELPSEGNVSKSAKTFKIDKIQVANKEKKVATAQPKRSGPPAQLIGKEYAERFRKIKSYADKKALFTSIVDEENWYRELFAQKRDAKELNDPYLLLVPAHENEDIFKFAQPFTEENSLPFLFPVKTRPPAGEKTIVSASEFQRNFDIFTESQLRFLNWDNVFCAGGSVLAALQPPPGEHNASNRTRRKYYHEVAYKSSDIDLFIYGLETEEQANKKLAEIYNAICESIPVQAICFRSTHAVTIVSQYPYRHIQVILRLYKSPAEILMGFDVDSCSVGYDGKKVWVTPRAQRALTHQYNEIDMSRRSPTYEQRLAKYGSRGYAVLVPSLERDRVDPQLFERRFDQLQGLARLILLETISTPEARSRYKDQQRLRRLRPAAENKGGFLAKLSSRFNNDYDRERMIEMGTADASDYSTVFLPWGPKYDAEKTRKMMYTKDMILNSKWYDPDKKIHTHPCFFGTAEEICRDCCGACPPVPPELEDPDSPFVSGKMTWLMVNPGQQGQIGSFHPITEGDWTEGAYILPESEQMVRSINSDDVEALASYILEGGDVNARDSVGRTALHLCAFTGSNQCAELLLKNGARISAKMVDGRTPLHVAAAYGRDKIVELIIKRGKEVEQEVIERAKRLEEEKKNAKKKGKKGKKEVKKGAKKPKKKKGESEEEEEMEEEEEEAEEMEEEEEEGEGMEEEEGEGGDEDFVSIKKQVEQKKKSLEDQNKELDPLVEEGDDVFDINLLDWDFKMTPVHYAVFFGYANVLTKLIEGGANFNLFMKESTILEVSLENSNLHIAKLLLEKGVSINTRNQSYQTLLHRACIAKDFEFVKMIVEFESSSGPADAKKAVIDVFDSSNKTPLNYVLDSAGNAITLENDDPLNPEALKIIKLLIKNGAKGHYSKKDWDNGRTQQQIQFNSNNFNGSDRSILRRATQQPITQAANLGSQKLIELFLDEGAEINWANSSGDTPLDIIATRLWNYEDSEIQERNGTAEEQQKAFIAEMMKKLKPDSFEFSELLYSLGRNKGRRKTTPRKKQPLLNPDQKEAEETRKAIRKKEKALYTDLEKFLHKKGAKTLVQLKLTSDDSDLVHTQDNRKRYPRTHGHQKATYNQPTIQYYSIAEQIPGVYSRNKQYPQESQKDYEKLFHAIWDGDIKKVEELTIKRAVGKQLHVCSYVYPSTRSTLQLAISRGHDKLVTRLIEISLEQYTPFTPPSKQKKGDKTPLINNYELAQMFESIKPGRYLDASGLPLDEKYEPLDPNAPVKQFNCITSPSSLIKFENNRRNVLHFAAIDGGNTVKKCVEALFDVIKAKKISNNTGETSDHPKAKNEAKDMIERILLQRDNQQLTPFEAALGVGNVELAHLFLEHKGVELHQKGAAKEKDEDVYEGLDVGGQKMDWAKEHQAPEKVKFERTALHVAAAFNQPESVTYLLKEAPKTIKKVFPDSKEVEQYFSIEHVDANGNTPFHYATHSQYPEVLETLISSSPNRELVDKCDKAGVNPLHIACANSYKDIVEVLVKGKANLTLPDAKRGWTPLHFAVFSGCKENVQLLLKHLPADAVNVPSKIFKQTPVMIAAYYGNTEILQLLLDVAKPDLKLRDVGGDFALHHASKGSNSAAVKVLLPKQDFSMNEENGVGLTPIDCARQIFLSSRNRAARDSFNYLVKTQQSEKRLLVNTETVTKVTNVMVQIASIEETKKRRRHYWEDEEEDDMISTNSLVEQGTIQQSFYRWQPLVDQTDEN